MDSKQYASFIRAVELQTVTLATASVRREWSKPEIPHAFVELDVKPRTMEVQDDFFRIRVTFLVSTRTSEMKDSDPVFTLKFSLDLTYSVASLDMHAANPKQKKEVLAYFIRRNVPMNVWPYAREFISSMTVRMGLPALVIATYKVNAQ